MNYELNLNQSYDNKGFGNALPTSDYPCKTKIHQNNPHGNVNNIQSEKYNEFY
jgi:hypothetical protein